METLHNLIFESVDIFDEICNLQQLIDIALRENQVVGDEAGSDRICLQSVCYRDLVTPKLSELSNRLAKASELSRKFLS